MIEQPMSRICTKCKVEKELAQFTKHKRGKYGRRSVCRICVSREGAQYRSSPSYKERIKQRDKQYYKKNEQRIKTRQALYVQNNRDKYLEYQRNYDKKRLKNQRKYTAEALPAYVKRVLILTGWPKEQITPEIIEIKRLQILTKRQIKKSKS